MTMRSWIRMVFARPVAYPPRKAPRRARLAVEALEQRCVQTFTVTNLLDDGSVGSLRWAVGQANMAGGAQSIDFDPTVFATRQTITLTGTQLELTDTTGTETITGPAVGVTVNGNNASRVFQIDGGVVASISGLTISGGNAGSGNGGGLSNLGTTTLTDCTVSGNSATGRGGGVYVNGGTLALTDCTVSGNAAGRGGGLYSVGGTTALTDCSVSGNTAGSDGGISIQAGTLTLTHCTVSGNYAYGFGGGLFNGGTTTLTNCTVSGNSTGFYGVGGGLANGRGTLTLTDCTVSGNFGGSAGLAGGIFIQAGTLTLTDCSVSGNSANGGGGIDAQGGTTTLTDCTVSGNSYVDILGVVHTRNSIISTLSGNLGSLGHNLIGNTNGGSGFDPTDLLNVNPLLGPLQNNGGPTQTMALLAGSPALNAGDPTQLGLADQRGVIRSGGVNIGAYQASAIAFLVSAPDAVQSGVPFDVTVTAVDPYSQVAVGYTGTVTFGTTDTDPGVVLPADYAFVSGDGGMHRFTDTGQGEVTLVTPGDQMLTVMDTADNTITGRIVITVSTGPAPHGHGPSPRTVPARPAQGETPTHSQPSASDAIALERWFASYHEGDYVWPTVPGLRHQARGDTTVGMADLFGGEDLLLP
jgi:predicted outer membrane repeat protein